MRLLVAPDSFTGTLSAAEAATAIAIGWTRADASVDVVLCPLSDGGPGFVAALQASIGGRLHTQSVTGPLRSPVRATVLAVGDRAYVESAQACGLHLIPSERRDPTRTTTAGVGELVLGALDRGAREVIVGLGGSGTTDGGAGFLAALGATAQAVDGVDSTPSLSGGGLGLQAVASVDLAPVHARLDGVRLLAATDVDVRLLGPRGAALGFAAQKGADEGQAQLLEQALTRWSSAVGRIDGRDISTRAGAGAAGGLGFALLAAGATWGAGIQTVLTASKLAQRMPAADLVVTGEGTLDWQSLQGKVVGGVAQLAREHRRPCLALAGRVTINPAESAAAGIFRAMSIVDDLKHRGQPPSAAFDEPDAHLSDLAESAARLWLRELRTERPS